MADDGIRMPRIVVRKGERALELYDGEQLVRRMRAALGRGEGPKYREGDGRTPEGLYRACVRNPMSKYHLSIGLNYPNGLDAARGLAEGLISPEQHEAIVRATEAGQRPPWDTGLGGEIMIHGGGSDRDWTQGCIALDDGDMDFLWERVKLGTEVEILP